MPDHQPEIPELAGGVRDTEIYAGGERSGHLRGGGVWPLRREVTDRAERIYRAVSEALAGLAERGRAPWMIARNPGHALPERPGGRPWAGPNGIVLAAAADRHGYADPRSPPSCASDLAAMGSISVSLLEAKSGMRGGRADQGPEPRAVSQRSGLSAFSNASADV